jgi:hypothetical protein
MSLRTTSVSLGVVLLALLALGGAAIQIRYKARVAAADSAHAALTQEIFDRLEAIPPGHAFPASLSELPLRYPDGGSAALLNRFTYHSTSTNSTVRTVLRGEEFKRSFP